MRYVRLGKCNHCGECCKKEVTSYYMINPVTQICRYLREADGEWICRIRAGELKLEKQPVRVQRYYKRECLLYPDPNDPAHCPPRHILPEKCGYRMVEAE